MKTLTLFDGSTVELGSRQPDEEESTSFSPAPPADIRLEDLPAEPRMMNVVCSVLSYTFMGVRPPDIALALGCTEQQLTDIMESEPYIRSHQMVVDSFIKGQQNSARDVISSNAVRAAQELVKVVRTSKSESNRLRASETILNKSGISDTGSDSMADGLVIRVVKDMKTDIHIKVG